MYRNYTKVTKAKARKLYNEGKEIFLHTSRLSWNNPWQNPYPFSKAEHVNTNVPADEGFDSMVASYAYYNTDKERGLRVIYLIENK